MRPNKIALIAAAAFLAFLSLAGFYSVNAAAPAQDAAEPAGGTLPPTPDVGLLLPFQEGEVYGYVNLSGKFVVAPQFVLARPFSEGLAAVSPDGQTYGYIDRSGALVIEPQFTLAGDFDRGIALVGLAGAEGQPPRFAYIDRRDEQLFDGASFAVALPFSEGFAGVSQDGRTVGFIDLSGALVITPTFSSAFPFSEGLAAVEVKDKYGYINSLGEMIIEPQFEYALPFSDGLAPVISDNKTGYINHQGRYVIEPIFERGDAFSEGRAAVLSEGQERFIDVRGRILTQELDFVRTAPFSEGLAAVNIDGLYGYVDRTGAVAIEPQFTAAGQFSAGLAAVETGDTRGVIDPEGNWLLRLAKSASVETAIEAAKEEAAGVQVPGARRTAAAPSEAIVVEAAPEQEAALSVAAAPSETAAPAALHVSTATLSTPLTATVVFDYVPSVPVQRRAGYCVANSRFVQLENAWECVVGEETVDPCFTAGDGKTLVCLPAPPVSAPGFVLDLTRPLPTPKTLADIPSDIWLFRTREGNLCSVAGRVSVQVGDRRVTHVCTDGTAVLGGIDTSSAVWTVEKVELVNNAQGVFSAENARTAEITAAWRPVAP